MHISNTVRAFILFALVALLGCSKDNPPEPKVDPNMATLLTQKINTFIYLAMDSYYLWQAQMPTNIDLRYEKEPKVYFDKLLYKPEDRWSIITDDYDAVSAGREGVETTFGYDLAYGAFPDNSYFAIVRFVFPDSPAAQAGLMRGSLITAVNGESITDENYQQLYYSARNELTLGRLEDNVIYDNGTITIEARNMSLSPIIEEKILEIDNQKIGYLHYSNFFSGSEPALDALFGRFKAAGVHHLVLDLRYNGGGALNTAVHLGSLIAPERVLNGNTILATCQWNAYYQDYWAKNNPDQLRVLFETKEKAVNNLNLDKVYILTGSGSASASELVMTGLAPYMDVVKIGNTTHGKYTASFLFQVEEYVSGAWSPIRGAENWGIQPIAFRYANALGVTDFKDGFVPDYAVQDALISGVKPLGDSEEPLLARAIELITGRPAPAVFFNTRVDGFTPAGHLLSRPDYFQGSVAVERPPALSL